MQGYARPFAAGGQADEGWDKRAYYAVKYPIIGGPVEGEADERLRATRLQYLAAFLA